jgi:hypothetical protein
MSSNDIKVYGEQRADLEPDLMAQLVILASREVAEQQAIKPSAPTVNQHDPSFPPEESMS